MNILEIQPKKIYRVKRAENAGAASLYDVFPYDEKGRDRSEYSYLEIETGELVMPIDDVVKKCRNGADILHYRKVLGVNKEFLGWLQSYLSLTEFEEESCDEHP